MTSVIAITPSKKCISSKNRLVILFFLGCLLCFPISDTEGQSKNAARISILIATGMPGGTYYHIGLGMASLWTTRLKGIGHQGFCRHVRRLYGEHRSDSDIRCGPDPCRGPFLFHGVKWDRSVQGSARAEMRSITALWPDVLHLLVRADKMQTGPCRT